MNSTTEVVVRASPSRDPDGGTLLAEAFEQLGVDTVFTLHGGHLDAALIALHDRGVQLVDTRHEQAAGMAADAWARMTGRAGVALVTAGPGVTNIVSALANAFLDAVPMVVIGGAAPLREAELLPLQGGLDQIALVRPVTKWAHQITRTDRIGELIVQAFRVATSGRPGPVFLEIPIDVLFAPLGRRAQVPAIARVEPADASADAIARVARLLIDAERPDTDATTAPR